VTSRWVEKGVQAGWQSVAGAEDEPLQLAHTKYDEDTFRTSFEGSFEGCDFGIGEVEGIFRLLSR
jgi:hypothetical protein